MKKFLTLMCVSAMSFICGNVISGARTIYPSGTYMFAQRDTCDLYLDVYDPAAGSEASVDGKTKPTIMFVFGGGFKTGSRDSESYGKWFKRLSEDGFRVVSIDYRLGLKDAEKVGLTQAGLVEDAIHVAVEDLFSATAFLIENAGQLGIDPSNIVISGSSAGAITVMQAEWELCNRMERAKVLPEDFNYAGVMSFAGAVFSRQGTVKYARTPCPTFMLHGTADKVVDYGQIWFFNLRFAGSDVLSRSFRKGGYNYDIFRFKDRGHEIASIMYEYYDEEMRFLRENVMEGRKVVIDALIDDETVPAGSGKLRSRKDLYGN